MQKTTEKIIIFMRESTKLKLIGVSVVLFTVAFVAAILHIALTDEPTKIEAGEVKPMERAQTYTVQGLSVQTSTTPDIFTILILSALAKDQNERTAIMRESKLTFSGPLEPFNKLLEQTATTTAAAPTKTAEGKVDLDEAKAMCEMQGGDFVAFRGDITNQFRALCTIRSRQLWEIEF